MANNRARKINTPAMTADKVTSSSLYSKYIKSNEPSQDTVAYNEL